MEEASIICDKLNRFVQCALQRNRPLTIQGHGSTDGMGFGEHPLKSFECRANGDTITYNFTATGDVREFSMKPSAHGIDQIRESFRKHPRIWVFEDMTLNDLNIIEK